MKVQKRTIKFPRAPVDGVEVDMPVCDLTGNPMRTPRSYLAEALQAVRIEASRAARCRDLAIKLHAGDEPEVELDKSDFELIKTAVNFAGSNIWPAWITAHVLDVLESATG